MAAIRNLELGLMFDEAATALPPAKKDLFVNIRKMLEELKSNRKDYP